MCLCNHLEAHQTTMGLRVRKEEERKKKKKKRKEGIW